MNCKTATFDLIVDYKRENATWCLVGFPRGKIKKRFSRFEIELLMWEMKTIKQIENFNMSDAIS
jgi:hypothetical protein